MQEPLQLLISIHFSLLRNGGKHLLSGLPMAMFTLRRLMWTPGSLNFTAKQRFQFTPKAPLVCPFLPKYCPVCEQYYHLHGYATGY